MAHILSNQWIGKRQPHWDRLALLLARSDQNGLGELSRSELQELALLYRQVAADLSVLRRDATARTYADHVNQLLARAHHIIYSGRKTNLVTLFRFLKDDYPAIFQSQLPFVMASLFVSVAWGLLGAALTSARPEFMRHFVGPAMIATMERHEMWTHIRRGVIHELVTPWPGPEATFDDHQSTPASTNSSASAAAAGRACRQLLQPPGIRQGGHE